MLILCFSLSLREQVHGPLKLQRQRRRNIWSSSSWHRDPCSNQQERQRQRQWEREAEQQQKQLQFDFKWIAKWMQAKQWEKLSSVPSTVANSEQRAAQLAECSGQRAAQLQRLPRNEAWRSQSGNANCANYVGHKALRYLLLSLCLLSLSPSLLYADCCCRSFYCHNRF